MLSIPKVSQKKSLSVLRRKGRPGFGKTRDSIVHGKNIRKDKGGFENFDDYFTENEDSLVPSSLESSPAKNPLDNIVAHARISPNPKNDDNDFPSRAKSRRASRMSAFKPPSGGSGRNVTSKSTPLSSSRTKNRQKTPQDANNIHDTEQRQENINTSTRKRLLFEPQTNHVNHHNISLKRRSGQSPLLTTDQSRMNEKQNSSVQRHSFQTRLENVSRRLTELESLLPGPSNGSLVQQNFSRECSVSEDDASKPIRLNLTLHSKYSSMTPIKKNITKSPVKINNTIMSPHRTTTSKSPLREIIPRSPLKINITRPHTETSATRASFSNKVANNSSSALKNHSRGNNNTKTRTPRSSKNQKSKTQTKKGGTKKAATNLQRPRQGEAGSEQRKRHVSPQPSQSSESRGLRRSKRNKLPVLEFWRNERPIYRRDADAFVIVNVDSGFDPELQLFNKNKNTYKKRTQRYKKPVINQNTNLSHLWSEDRIPNQDAPSTDYEVRNVNNRIVQDIEVVNPDSGKEVCIDCIRTKESYIFHSMNGDNASSGNGILVTKALQQKAFASGLLVMKPKQAKGNHYVCNDTMVFWILKGKLEVTIHETTVVLSTGDSFFVPQGNKYNLCNLRDTEAQLVFFQLKGDNRI